MNIKNELKNRLKNFISNSMQDAMNSPKKDRPCVYLGNNRILTKNIYGQKLICHASDISLTPHIVLDGYWENWITKVFLQQVHPGMTVLDIGANIGYYSTLAASIVGPEGHVVAFEANPELADIVASNFSINGYLGFTEIKNLAVYSESTTLSFNICEKHMGSSGIWVTNEVAERWHDHIHQVNIEAKALDDIFPSGTKIDFIKMDAEGAEKHILSGAQRLIRENKNISILMEFQPINIIQANGNIDGILEKIYSYGFTINEIKTDSTLIECTYDMAKNLEGCDILLKRRVTH